MNTQQSSQAKPTRKIILPVTPFEMEIIRSVYEDGAVVYQHPISGKVDTYQEDFEDMLRIILNNVSGLSGIMNDNDWGRFGYLIELIIENGKRRLDEIFKIIDEEIGRIKIDSVQHGAIAYRPERVVGVSIEHPKQSDESDKGRL